MVLSIPFAEIISSWTFDLPHLVDQWKSMYILIETNTEYWVWEANWLVCEAGCLLQWGSFWNLICACVEDERLTRLNILVLRILAANFPSKNKNFFISYLNACTKICRIPWILFSERNNSPQVKLLWKHLYLFYRFFLWISSLSTEYVNVLIITHACWSPSSSYIQLRQFWPHIHVRIILLAFLVSMMCVWPHDKDLTFEEYDTMITSRVNHVELSFHFLLGRVKEEGSVQKAWLDETTNQIYISKFSLDWSWEQWILKCWMRDCVWFEGF